jgi:regulator of protease activity HflC (stomatin/prohibitin superfamily)
LITQTLDPMLSAYFRDIAHKKNMLELLHDRDLIQQESRRELRARFQEFDIELVDVLIGKPDTTEKNSKIETLLEQLRLRQLSREQIATFQEQGLAAEKLQALKMAQAKAEKQTELTNSQMEIQINENRGSAELAKARMQAEQTVVTAEAENKRRLLLADAESRSNALLGEGQSKRTSLEGGAEADVLRQKISSFADPKLYALSVVAQYLSRSQQPLVPERLFVTGGKGDDGLAASGGGLLSTLIGLLSAEKAGFNDAVPTAPAKPAANDPLTHNQPTTASRPLAEGKPIAGKM